MLSRYLRPVTARVSSFATTPLRPTAFSGPFSIRTIANATEGTASVPKPAPIPPASEVKASRKLPYFVGRNNLNNLSVYHKKKRGGNLKLTVIKKAEGDLMALKQDLKAALQLVDNEVSVNSVTNHIVIKGLRLAQATHFLRTMGF